MEKENCIPMPKDFNVYNGGIRCDVLKGPCSCGAWHNWNNENELFEEIRKGLVK